LDEATSSLDGGTETEISDSIQLIKGKVTVVMIAHRLSTVRNADLVMYLENGHPLIIDTFEEVRKRIPNFDAQARLMGL
jgi:ABC-type multidrug transport system fused ATPase/permease subunit